MRSEQPINYWKQKASPWVSMVVLAGGLTTALILFFLVRVENQIEFITAPVEEAYQNT